MEDVQAPRFKFTVEQLAEQRELFRSQSLEEVDEQVAAISAQIKLQQQAKLVEQHGPIRAKQAEKKVSQCKTRLDHAEKQVEDLRSKLADLQRQILEQEG